MWIPGSCFVSGQRIGSCSLEGVYHLKKGYEIETVLNKGNKLHNAGEIYGKEELSHLLNTNWAGRNLVFLPVTDSTNVQAKIQAEMGAPQGTLVVADCQTAGRGRRGREWESPTGVNIYFTLLLLPEFSTDKASMLTLLMADATAKAIEEETGIQVGIKWPNDIVINGKKVCGILTEMSIDKESIHYLVTGVGINVCRQNWKPSLAEKVTSLEEEAGREVARGALLTRIMMRYEEDFDLFLAAGNLTPVLESYQSRLVNKDSLVKVLDPKGEWEGIARGISPEGELLVETQEGIVPVYAGEVSVRGIYGYV